MPRHPQGDKAMTGAERQRRWRMRKELSPAPHDADPSVSPELIEARKEIARLRRRNRRIVEAVKSGAEMGALMR